MKRPLYIISAVVLLLGMFCARDGAAESLQDNLSSHVSGGLNIRVRSELWNTFQKKDSDTDRTYDFYLLRARPYIDFDWKHVSLHLMVQGVQALNLPDNGAFGPGVVYFRASDERSNPGNFQFVEGYVHLKDIKGFYLKGGRIGFNDGAQVLYKDAQKLNWLIKTRLSERLISNWDWTLVGRRYDGGSGGYDNDTFNLDLMGANVTFGGFDVEDGLWKDLDTVVVTGGAFTVKKDVLLPNTQFQLFNYFYFDDRTPAITLAGDSLKINTTGVSMVGAYPMGRGELDTMLWFAFQLGDFGNLNQKALAFIGELGYPFTRAPWKPWLRVGLAYSSGDGDPDDSDFGTFFNMVSENHKWYGHVDANAFSNLIDTYTQTIFKPHPKVTLGLDGHLLWLASDQEVLIEGAGPFNDSEFGYAFRKPLPGNDIETFLGGEIDIATAIKTLDHLIIKIGYSHFFGAEGIEVVFDGKT